MSENRRSVAECGGSMTERGGRVLVCGSSVSESGGSVPVCGRCVAECGGSMTECRASINKKWRQFGRAIRTRREFQFLSDHQLDLIPSGLTT